MQRIALALVVSLFAGSLAAQDGPTLGAPFTRLPPIDERPAESLPPPQATSASPAAPSESPAEIVVLPEWSMWTPVFWDPWEGNVELGLSGTEGNSQTFNVRFGLTAKHKTDTLVQSLQITSIQKSANRTTTANTALLDGRIEWPMPQSRFNYYIHGLTEYDEFKRFDYRLSADSGIGFEFIQNDATTLIGRSGLSISQEFGGTNDEAIPEWALGGEFKHKFNPTHSISAKLDYFPGLTDFTNFRLNSQAAWEVALVQAWGLSLKFSLIDRYDSTPQGARPNDLDYSTMLIWQF